MKMRIMAFASGLLAMSLAASPVMAKVSPEEAEKLGNELTPMGGEKAGNGDEIPAWDGGLQKIPEDFDSDGPYIDPFPGDEPLFVIDQNNVDEYKDRLSPGQVKMINQYDDYKMPVYKTRRTVNYPEYIQEVVKDNAVNAELIKGGNGLSFKNVVPFPIPQSGLEVIWNHITRYRGGSVARDQHQVTPTVDGDYKAVKFEEELTWNNALTNHDPDEDPNVLFYFTQKTVAPSRLAGDVLLVHETIDQVKEPRRAWVYNSAQRRVRRAPSVAYDGPGTASDGLRTDDNFDMYNGAPDRYNWELIDKKEMYIPYNSYRVNDASLSYDQIVKPGHINQEYARYELHRVWHVRATLRDGSRHIYAQRDFYVDEDSWSASVIDLYDGRGQLWRVQEGHNMFMYDAQVPFYGVEAIYDTLSKRYLLLTLTNEINNAYRFGIERTYGDYSPAALRRSGRR